MPIRTISSALTPWIKIVLPVIWVLGTGIYTLGIWLGVIHENYNGYPLILDKYLFLAIWIFILVCSLWGYFRYNYKRVRLDSHQLYLSNYFKEITIPFNAIKDIKQNPFLSIRPITIYFRDRNVFGKKIIFLPTLAPLSGRVHPLVAELKQLAALS